MTPQTYYNNQLKAAGLIALGVLAFLYFCITHSKPEQTVPAAVEERVDTFLTIGDKLYSCRQGKISYYKINLGYPVEWPKNSPGHVMIANIRLISGDRSYFVICDGDHIEVSQ